MGIGGYMQDRDEGIGSRPTPNEVQKEWGITADKLIAHLQERQRDANAPKPVVRYHYGTGFGFGDGTYVLEVRDNRLWCVYTDTSRESYPLSDFDVKIAERYAAAGMWRREEIQPEPTFDQDIVYEYRRANGAEFFDDVDFIEVRNGIGRRVFKDGSRESPSTMYTRATCDDMVRKGHWEVQEIFELSEEQCNALNQAILEEMDCESVGELAALYRSALKTIDEQRERLVRIEDVARGIY